MLNTDPSKIVGMEILEARYMTPLEQEDFGFYQPCLVLVLGQTDQDGQKLTGMVTCDPEMNGPGTLFLANDDNTEEHLFGSM